MLLLRMAVNSDMLNSSMATQTLAPTHHKKNVQNMIVMRHVMMFVLAALRHQVRNFQGCQPSGALKSISNIDEKHQYRDGHSEVAVCRHEETQRVSMTRNSS